MLDETAPVDWHHELVDQLAFHWQHLRRRLDGMTDEEYRWEPVPGCWTVRVHEDGSTSRDRPDQEPDPPPFTTIAWRMAHIIGDIFGRRAASHFGYAYAEDTVTWPATAQEGLALLDATHDAWTRGVAGLSVEDLHRKVGPAEGPFQDHPMAALVLHINREAIHHGAEIACLRDLYRHSVAPGGRTV